MRRALFVTTLALGLAAAPFASAEGTVDQAKALFNAGASAYASGQFEAAIQAFESANKLVPKPAIVFSIAQAHRRQYFLDKNPEHLRTAVSKYHQYIDQVAEGGRRADAAQALAELEPMLSKIGGEAATAPGPAAKEPARLMVMTQTEGAAVALDGNAGKEAPLAAEVTPGKHHVKVTAAGFFDDERDVLAIDGTLIPVDVVMRERPAHLSLRAPDNAQVTLDGRPVGITPLGAAVDVAAGTHLLAVAKNGFKAHTEEVDLARDERKELVVHLAPSGQRVAAYSLFIGGGAALLAGGAFTVAALTKQGDAQSILDRRTSADITEADAASYDRARKSRDDWNRVSIVAYGIGGAALLTGVVLYAFDQPVVGAPSPRYDNKPKRPSAPSKEPAEMALVPMVSPQFVGGSFTAKF